MRRMMRAFEDSDIDIGDTGDEFVPIKENGVFGTPFS